MFFKFKPKKKMSKKKKLAIIFLSIFIPLCLLFGFLLYGPYEGFRNFWITSSMTTMTHQWMAKMFYSDETIMKVLENNGIIEPEGTTDTNLIKFKKYSSNARFYKNKYEAEILKDSDGLDYRIIDIKGSKYQGYLVAVYDPSKVYVTTTKYLKVRGEAITTVAKRENALIAVNGGGFYDPDWNSNGALPHGPVISHGKLVSNYERSNVGGGIVGLTNDNKLVLGRWSGEEALKKGVRDAVDFGPFLIVNGKSSFVKGNGGWGIAPRTAIAQRKDGIILFLIINGRIPSSIGADMGDLCEILENYGAVNAANMDGGSSTELVINNKIINHPVAAGANGLRDMATFWMVKR